MDDKTFTKRFIEIINEWTVLYNILDKREYSHILLKFFRRNNITDENILHICTIATDKCSFLPKPADLLKIYKDHRGNGPQPKKRTQKELEEMKK